MKISSPSLISSCPMFEWYDIKKKYFDKKVLCKSCSALFKSFHLFVECFIVSVTIIQREFSDSHPLHLLTSDGIDGVTIIIIITIVILLISSPAMASMGSKAPKTVVPAVQLTKKGRLPSALSFNTRFSNSSGIMRPLWDKSLRLFCLWMSFVCVQILLIFHRAVYLCTSTYGQHGGCVYSERVVAEIGF